MQRLRYSTIPAVTLGLGGVALFLGAMPVLAQSRPQIPTAVPRAPDGKPDMSGLWQAFNTANWDLLDHAGRQAAIIEGGAAFAVPPGVGVVEGNAIPYQPWAEAKKKENGANWLKLDPEVKCYLPGVPRANYMPYPFQIFQTPGHVLFAYEYADANRTIYLSSKADSPVDSWMGTSNGRWEGDTLVVDVVGFNDQSWFDRSGNFHSEALHVVERYSMLSPHHIWYEATIEDPKVFTRPWKIAMPLYRRVETNAQLLEFKCVEFVEEMMYGHLKKKTN